MSQPTVIRAQMIDGTIIRETVCTFDAFLAVVLPLRRDPCCTVVRWHRASDRQAATEIREAELRALAVLTARARAERWVS